MSRQRAIALMVICLFAAAMLRFPALQEVPPGLHYDEAANALLASDIGLGGERPIFIPSYTGKEVFFFYAAGAMMRFLGSSIFTLRLTAAFFGLLTVAASYWLGRELLVDRRVALIAAALIAVSFWHLLFSRLGFRAISQPLLQALAVAALFRGLKRQSWPWLVVGGLSLGLTAYSYLAARLFPPTLGLALLPLLAGREKRSLRMRQLAVFIGVAFLVLVPLLVYFWLQSDAFWVRIRQVAPGSAGASLAQSYGRTLGMFFLLGDPYWRFNLPGRPLFNWLWGGLLVVGWGVALWRWRRWWYDWQKSAVILLLLVPFLMILPTALAVGEIIPSNLRAIGLIPFIFYLPSQGLVTLLEQVADRFRRPGRNMSFVQYLRLLEGYDINYAFVVLLILLVGGTYTGRAYFEEWANRTDLFYDSDSDLTAVAGYLDTLEAENVYVAALHYRHPTVAFLSDRYEAIRWLPKSQTIIFPDADEAVYVYPHNSPAPSWVVPYLAEGVATHGPEGPDDEPTFTAYRLTDILRPAPPVADPANFGNRIRLLGYEVGTGATGGSLPLTLFWEVTGPPAPGVQPFVHLLDLRGNRWSQAAPASNPSEQWVPGDLIVQRIDTPVPAGAPPGRYRLRTGFFDPSTDRRLPRLDDQGRYAGDSLLIDGAIVAAGLAPDVPPRAPSGVSQVVRPGLHLLGYERAEGPVATGEQLPLALWWWATDEQPPLTVRLELLRADYSGVILLQTEPAHGSYPFDQWEVPRFLIDDIDPVIPPDLAPGEYRLQLRLIEEGGSIFEMSLGPLAVEPTERSFVRPPLQFPLAATFGNEIELVGYDLEQAGQQEYRLSLAWQALIEPADDYTVFVHVLSPDGVCCIWQSDRMPQQGAYPTGRWLSGEVVVDRYRIELPGDLPAGDYPLEVGLYRAQSGQRLRMVMPGVQSGDALLLRSLTVE